MMGGFLLYYGQKGGELMITNEQRAHDLAILMVQFKLTPESFAAEALKTSGQELRIQVEELYFEAYELALGAINRHFQN